ncbi:hypothetical protein PUN28_020917 [Cardiocondyla obscurior]|uniref:Uncharacterized protein n=1 Tax=Cardiocondyla obscurior TaxID=286306 RepID=A0AAW2EAZ4_9HYME
MIDLTEDHLNELKISIGQRIIFKNKIKHYIEEKKKEDILNMELIFEHDFAQSSFNQIITETVASTEVSSDNQTKLNSEMSTDSEFESNERKKITASSSSATSETLVSFDKPNFPDFDLKDILNKSPYRSIILKYYTEKKTLNPSLRNKLVDIIARHLYNYINKWYVHIFPYIIYQQYRKMNRQQGNLLWLEESWLINVETFYRRVEINIILEREKIQKSQ